MQKPAQIIRTAYNNNIVIAISLLTTHRAQENGFSMPALCTLYNFVCFFTLSEDYNLPGSPPPLVLVGDWWVKGQTMHSK